MNLQETLKYYGKTSIWHFTDESNLKSIKEHGILSLLMITQNKIHVPCFGADAESHYRDKIKGLDNYVHLSLIKEHPMQHYKVREGLIPNPVWLEIDISVLFDNLSLCCNQIANATSAKCHDIQKLAEVIDMDSLINNPYCSYEIKKAQLLVAKKIEYSKIKGIHYG